MESKIAVGGHDVTGLALSVGVNKHAEVDELVGELEKGDDVTLIIRGRVKGAGAVDVLGSDGTVRETNGRLTIHAFSVDVAEEGIVAGAWEQPIEQLPGQTSMSDPDPEDVAEARARLAAEGDVSSDEQTGEAPAEQPQLGAVPDPDDAEPDGSGSSTSDEDEDPRSPAQKDRVPAEA